MNKQIQSLTQLSTQPLNFIITAISVPCAVSGFDNSLFGRKSVPAAREKKTSGTQGILMSFTTKRSAN